MIQRLTLFLVLGLTGCGTRVVGGNDAPDGGAPDEHDGAPATANPFDLAGGAWHDVGSFTGQDFRAVSARGPLLVAVGNFGMIYTSPEGQAWTQRYEDLETNLLAVAHSPAGYAAVGKYGSIVHSPDGLSWTAVPDIATERLRAISRFGNGFIALGSEIVISSDGSDWVNHGPAPEEFTSVLEVDGRLYALAFEDDFVATMYSSDDGINWTAHESPMPDIRDLNGICEHDGTFVAVGEEGRILTSTDGVSWIARESGTTMRLESVACSGTGFAVAGRFAGSSSDPLYDAGVLLTSEDAISWQTALAPDESERLYGVDTGSARALAVGKDGTILINSSQ